MKSLTFLVLVTAALIGSSLHAAVGILSFAPAVHSPQALGFLVNWSVTASDTNTTLLTFQYSVSAPGSNFQVVRDFSPGKFNGSTWNSSFAWRSYLREGTYSIRVIAKDFRTGESATATLPFKLYPRSTQGRLTANVTSNPLVGLISAPSCSAGSLFQLTITNPATAITTLSNAQACNPAATTNMLAAGMLPSTSYLIGYQTITNGVTTPSANQVTFRTGSLPGNIAFPSFNVLVPPGPQSSPADQVVLHSLVAFTKGELFAPVATDRNGNIIWYYTGSAASGRGPELTHPVAGGTMLTIQSGAPWGTSSLASGQFLREVDLTGNIVRETNVGVLQQQLAASGATDFIACSAIQIPASTGAGCMGTIHHDAIRLPNGNTALIVNLEKIYPPGTQGSISGNNVDVIGDGILVLDTNFQVTWYFDTFQHAGGAPELDINRAAILGEACMAGSTVCPTLFLAGTSGVDARAPDWLHFNSLFYEGSTGDFIVSSRHQDWIIKVDYQNGAGTGNVLWRMGQGGDFTFNNVNNDPYPWFTHQHDAEFENTGGAPMTLFDNGNTRIAPPPVGVGSGNSRGMSLLVDQINLTVTPALSQDLGYFSTVMGNAQLLPNGNFCFQPGAVGSMLASYALEVFPTTGTVNGTIVYGLQTSTAYRTWLMTSLYQPNP